MSVCLEPNSILTSSSSTVSTQKLLDTELATSLGNDPKEAITSQSVAKLVITPTSCPSNSVLHKVPTSSVITVVNATGPLTILKTLCSNSYGTAAPQFTLVNSTPLNVSNAAGKPITVVGAPPITVVRTIQNINPNQGEENVRSTDTSGGSISNLIVSNGPINAERPPIHNVFVKNTLSSELLPSAEPSKIQKVNSFSPNNVLPALTSGNVIKTVNGQKAATPTPTSNKLKIVSNIIVPPTSSAIPTCTSNPPSNIVLNKSQPVARNLLPHKPVGNPLNGAPKFLNRSPPINNFPNKSNSAKGLAHKSQKLVYPTHKGQLKTIPPVSLAQKVGIKTLAPQSRGISNQHVQRTSSGLRTIPPQRSPKSSNKPNYIGKHAIQAQKFKNPHSIGKLKSTKPLIPAVNVFPSRTPQNTGVTYHQALTANILQSLSESSSNSYTRSYDFGSRYDGNQAFLDTRNNEVTTPPVKPQSNLEALSFVCQAVLLDHNYNATPPAESLNRNVPTTSTSPQLNGSSLGSYYSPNSNASGSTNTLSTLSSSSITSVLPNSIAAGVVQDDDAASDISCGSDRKIETEGEETDTAPEAEAVNNEDHYGDYVTRCICGFLHDDGYMIECDKCKVWQHVRCVIKSNKKVPDDYLCELCDPNKPVDRGKARTLQQQWMRENQEREAKLRKEARLREMKLKETLSDSDSSDAETIGGNLLSKSRIPSNSRRKMDQNARLPPRQRRESKSEGKRNIKRKERRPFKKKVKPPPKNHSDEETQEGWSHSSISQMPQLRQWIEHYEDAVTNHYSPELRARISNIKMNGIHSDLSSQIDNSVHKCRIFTQPLTGLKFLVSATHLPPNTPVVELRGKYMLSTQHRTSTVGHSGSLTTRQHAQRPGPFLFFYRLHKDNTEVCVDTRTYGNEARFIRRSCKPNSELRHCIEKGVLHLYIFTVTAVEKNCELTIKHESHDLAVIGTCHVSCACGNSSECAVNKPSIKNESECTEANMVVRKRRGRRLASTTPEVEPTALLTPKEEPPPSPVEVKQEDIEVKQEDEIKTEPEEEVQIKEELEEIKKEEEPEAIVKEEPCRSPSPPVKKSGQQSKSDSEDKKESPTKECLSADKQKLSREERKLQAIMKAFERMEKQEQRRQEHQAKQAHRRESEPCPSKDDDKMDSKVKRRRRKGRARTISTNSQSRQNRLNSSDSLYATSGDECMLSPTDSLHVPIKDGDSNHSPSKDVGLLTTVVCDPGNRSDVKSPIPNVDCNSNSANSSPETPLSSACLLVAAAVEPLEPNFKFPKTKKGLMNEWITKSTECIQSASSISPSSLTPHIVPVSTPETYYENATNNFFGAAKNLVALAQAANYCDLPTQPLGNAKKRWLRQAISEDQCDSPSSRPESPPLTEMVPPPKKRRLPRESLSSDNSPPTTPTNFNLAVNGGEEVKRFKEHEDRVEIVTAGNDGDSPTRVVIDDASLKERVAEMQQEIGACFRLPEPIVEVPPKELASTTPPPLRCALDPRLSRPLFNTSEHLVATVEKNLSILGFEDKTTHAAPIKRKLSITEYRQRKQLTLNEKLVDEAVSEENTSSQSPPLKLRTRSDSNSSATSFASSDEEFRPPELTQKALSAFNSEPTELEKQRESVSLRLKKAFGLSIDEDSRKPALSMETLLNCDLNSAKTSLPGFGSTVSTCSESNSNPPILETVSAEESETCSTMEVVKSEVISDSSLAKEELTVARVPTPSEVNEGVVNPKMFYIPDEEDADKTGKEEAESIPDAKCDEFVVVESTNYVPPFNNPVYPNSSFTSFGSVIDDETRYEGRNPSPPPELTSAPNYSSP
uniref:SET domain-containing protein n=1 Tax=Photinus pyralis TaxID=7054 RepID=A0A1Y1NA62_PHOPY